MPTKIEWATETWEIVRGCTPVSDGCKNCYAERLAKGRLKRFYPNGFREVIMRWDMVNDAAPVRWRNPRRVFVCSRSDLFHAAVTMYFQAKAFERMALLPHHQFLVLTKRPDRMRNFAEEVVRTGWPDNVWAGVSVESQGYDWRIEQLSHVPAKVRFVSLEPLLRPVDLRPWLRCPTCLGDGIYENGRDEEIYACPHCGPDGIRNKIHWVIVGGESGPGARPMNPEWVRSIRNQCREAGVPFFFKQWGEYAPRGVTPGPEYGQMVPRMEKVGKKAAGCTLDGEIIQEYPE
jgi:protein gp37